MRKTRPAEAHPKDTWPPWFEACTTYGGKKIEDNIWKFSFTAIPSSSLGPGETWEEHGSGYVLVKTDPVTMEREIISNTASDVVAVFEAIVDLSSDSVSVVNDIDLASVDGKTLLPFRKWGDPV